MPQSPSSESSNLEAENTPLTGSAAGLTAFEPSTEEQNALHNEGHNRPRLLKSSEINRDTDPRSLQRSTPNPGEESFQRARASGRATTSTECAKNRRPRRRGDGSAHLQTASMTTTTYYPKCCGRCCFHLRRERDPWRDSKIGEQINHSHPPIDRSLIHSPFAGDGVRCSMPEPEAGQRNQWQTTFMCSSRGHVMTSMRDLTPASQIGRAHV